MTVNWVKKGSNMYGFITGTWNTLGGRCSHSCVYCFNIGKPFFCGDLRFMEKNLKDKLGENQFIFVGSSNDLFADNVPIEWILKTLDHCKKYPNNKYLFQSKNPLRMLEVFDQMHIKFNNMVLGTTIETNRDFKLSNAPSADLRVRRMQQLSLNHEVMLTLEPICDFDLDIMVDWIKAIKPKWINIGADSKKHNLPEPTALKIGLLVERLKGVTEIKLKKNLARIYPSMKV